MTGYLIDYSGNQYELPEILSWSVSHGTGYPCDAFEITCVCSADMKEMLSAAVRFRGMEKGETVFFGVVDEYEIRCGQEGFTVGVSGRGLAALLMDNEAEAAEYMTCTLDILLGKYVRPLGIDKIMADKMKSLSGYGISSGSSCWSAISGFTRFAAGIEPRFSPDGTLIISAGEGNRREIGGSVGAFDISYTGKRYGVISEITVADRVKNKKTTVKNEKFLKRGGLCRRVITVPRNTGYDAMRYTGGYQIRESEKRAELCRLKVAEVFAAFPNEIIDINLPQAGIRGSFSVIEAVSWAGASGAGTEITMIPR